MNLCIGDTVPPTTEKAKVLRQILYFLLAIQLALSLIKFYFQIWGGIAEFISIFILCSALSQLNYCNCVIYIFFCLMNTFVIIVNFLTDIQNRVNLETQPQSQQYQFVLQSASLTFYIVSVYFSFQAYREFKGIAYDVYAATTNNQSRSVN
ncbi:hypothetical protein pb186bvf_000977 [Paramecium bursaria]